MATMRSTTYFSTINSRSPCFFAHAAAFIHSRLGVNSKRFPRIGKPGGPGGSADLRALLHTVRAVDKIQHISAKTSASDKCSGFIG